MKQIYHIYFDCSGSELIGELTTSSGSEISLNNAKFIDNNGVEKTMINCQVNKNKIAFYYIERKCSDD